MKAKLEAEAPKIAAELGLGIAIEPVGHFDPVTFDKDCVKAVRDAADRLGYSHRDIVSGAGHDACWINRVAPTAMVMCPCVDGLSPQRGREHLEGMGDGRAPTSSSTRWSRQRRSWRERRHVQTIAAIYRAFNARDIEGVLDPSHAGRRLAERNDRRPRARLAPP